MDSGTKHADTIAYDLLNLWLITAKLSGHIVHRIGTIFGDFLACMPNCAPFGVHFLALQLGQPVLHACNLGVGNKIVTIEAPRVIEDGSKLGKGLHLFMPAAHAGEDGLQ